MLSGGSYHLDGTQRLLSQSRPDSSQLSAITRAKLGETILAKSLRRSLIYCLRGRLINPKEEDQEPWKKGDLDTFLEWLFQSSMNFLGRQTLLRNLSVKINIMTHLWGGTWTVSLPSHAKCPWHLAQGMWYFRHFGRTSTIHHLTPHKSSIFNLAGEPFWPAFI